MVLDEEGDQQGLELETIRVVAVAVDFNFRLKNEFGRGAFINNPRHRGRFRFGTIYRMRKVRGGVGYAIVDDVHRGDRRQKLRGNWY